MSRKGGGAAPGQNRDLKNTIVVTPSLSTSSPSGSPPSQCVTLQPVLIVGPIFFELFMLHDHLLVHLPVARLDQLLLHRHWSRRLRSTTLGEPTITEYRKQLLCLNPKVPNVNTEITYECQATVVVWEVG